MEFKLSIGDPKTGKTVKKVISDKQAEVFLKKRIGEKLNGDDIGFAGYEFEITGGSDYCGFPMRRDVRGTARKRILIVSGVGIRKNKKSRKGKKIRRTVAGNTIYSRTAQINLKILKYGAKPLAEEKKEEKPAESEAPKEAEKKEAPKKEEKKEKPKKEEKPKEEKTAEAKEEKKPEERTEDKKEEQKKEPVKEKNK
ncbi:30S ribosomal protein S6e [Candidatus Woesearchaeota archaeon]|nr:30S ribosomal protein S6e [Candidatus Woesearchaeota archaeon]